MKKRIYIDTSVVGGYFDKEFQEETMRLYNWFEDNDVVFVISDLLDLELLNAPEKVKNSLQIFLFIIYFFLNKILFIKCTTYRLDWVFLGD